MNIVLIVPTGIGAEIGGHAGDGNPIVKLLASTCDNLITHPNVVNASDINEMTENTLYVEGSMLDDFLEGKTSLKKVYSNKILLAVNEITTSVVNSASAARATIGADVRIVKLKKPLGMIATMGPDGASGHVGNWIDLCAQVNEYEFDALAIATPIKVEKDIATFYLENGGINPWGGVEARASRLISEKLKKPVAHSPIDDKESDTYKLMCNLKKPVDPRMAAELVSVSYLHCILKGLHRAPRRGKGLSVGDVDFLISPAGCWGRPHKACYAEGIPIIVVKENRTRLKEDQLGFRVIRVENYLEAAGYIQSVKAGVSLESIRRPLPPTKVIKGNVLWVS